jgi:plasmid stabilization system protein ParE
LRLRITSQALIELDDILTTIASSSPRAAERVAARLQDVAERLLAFPKTGQPTSSTDLRRYVARPYPYAVFYLVADDEIVVIAYRHAARDPSSMPG